MHGGPLPAPVRFEPGLGETVIYLDRDYEMLISVEDYPMLITHRWRAQLNVERGNVYAVRTTTIKGRSVKIYAHRQITAAPKGSIVDHKNRCTLDCRRRNLRVCTIAQNGHNRDKLAGVVPYIGVSRDGRKFRARISFEGERMHLGAFETAEEAALAYDLKAVELLGAFAWVNFPRKSARPLEMEYPPL